MSTEPRDEYTPTVSELRDAYIRHDVDCGSYGRALMNIETPTDDASGAEFDRAIAAHDREVAADALDTAADAFDVHGRSRGEAIAANTLRASATAIREGRTDA